MSLTVTQTISQTQGAVLRLRKSPSQRVQTLLARIREAARAIPQGHQDQVFKAIREWEAIFLRDYQVNSPEEEERLKSAHALLFLRVSHIELSVIGLAVDLEEKIKWVTVSNKIKKIVTKILPQHMDVEAFIEADRKKQLEVRTRYKTAKVLDEVMPQIMETFERLEDRLFDCTNSANQEVQREFEEVKGVLASLNGDRAAAIERLHGEFEQLTTNIINIYQTLETQLNETQERGEQIHSKQMALQQLLDACEDVVRKV